MEVLRIEQLRLLVLFIVHERFDWRATVPDIHDSCSLRQHCVCVSVCVYCKPVRTSLFGAKLSMTTKLTYLITVVHTK